VAVAYAIAVPSLAILLEILSAPLSTFSLNLISYLPHLTLFRLWVVAHLYIEPGVELALAAAVVVITLSRSRRRRFWVWSRSRPRRFWEWLGFGETGKKAGLDLFQFLLR